jgi:DNA polymerase III subunit epsilon
MLDTITYLDLETTGATPLRDRITEVALVRFEHGVEVARWQTLVNPEQSIPVFIQNLTGINNEMVATAPTFAQIADKLHSFLEGAVLAAHNVRFDHGFIKAEFKRLGITLRQKVLCTVKLSRLLYPEFKSHGLDAIVQRHQIANIIRHRAMGDVEAMLAFVDVARMELGEPALIHAVKKLMSAPSLPPHLDAHLLEDMPETPGVYLFYGENNLPLYIGKSVNLRARVLSHFNSDHASTREMRISQEIKHIEWITTAGEFSALLLESRLIKERQPIYNRQLRNERQLCTWQLSADPHAIPLVTLLREEDVDPSQLNSLYGTFKTKRQATEVLRTLAEQHQLCPKYLGLESWSKGACFSHQIRRCKGACCAKEPPEIHHLRLQQALMAHRIKIWPFAGKVMIKEHSEENDKVQLHVFEHWTYLGAAESEEALLDICEYKTQLKFDHDTYKLLLKAFNSQKMQIVPLPDKSVEVDLY